MTKTPRHYARAGLKGGAASSLAALASKSQPAMPLAGWSERMIEIGKRLDKRLALASSRKRNGDIEYDGI